MATSVPILPSADLERTRAFYCFLGFTVVDAADEYLRLRYDDAEVHFYPAPDTDPAENPSGWYLRVQEPEELREKWSHDGVECPEVPVPAVYGPTVFAVADPDGALLRVGPADRL
ncbi:catechol 2,3-dioxygenase-like lactoylglutathione lyase family enzyme [Catenulispora sp. MAP12-49]|uniref:VOC family protein n=1 Tax=Catenulispora sp. MAP12-49 TaxID=3156302 RepID=UPI003518EE48